MPVKGQSAKREKIDAKRVRRREIKAAEKAARNGKHNGYGRSRAPGSVQQSLLQ